MLASVVAMLAPRLARAEYEYTAKVQSGTGTAKESSSYAAWYRAKVNCQPFRAASGWSSSLPTGTPSIAPLQYYNDCAGAADYGNWVGTFQPSGNFLAVDYNIGWNGDPSSPWPGVAYFTVERGCPNGGTYDSGTQQCTGALACPAGKVEGQDGLCYSLACPTATPAWEPDPGNSSQCRRPLACPYPQILVVATGQCECQSGRLWAVPPSGGLSVPVHGQAQYSAASSTALASAPSTACMSATGASGEGGCSFEVDYKGWDGAKITLAGDRFTGSKCTVSTNGATEGDKPCPAGQVKGTINGQSVCVTAGVTETSKPPTTSTETKTNPDGTTTTTTTTTQETTKCEAGVCTTTITKSVTETNKDAQGNTTGTTTTAGTETKPGTGSGGNGDGDGDGVASSFGGSCPSFTCDGDAIQCAIALEQHKRNCELLTDKGEFTREDAEGEFDSARNFDPAQLTTEGSLASISSSTFLGGGCLADATYDVHGYSLTIPFSSLCVYLQAAGLAFLAVCGLISFGIVSRGVTA